MTTRFPSTGQLTPAGGSRPTAILYVDDEPALLALTKVFLERQGLFSVETAESAIAALERIAAGSYDVIVSDYQMPGMDGIEFLRAIRAARDATPFIIFTGKGREEVVIEAFDSGADFYVQKGGNPAVQFAELVHKINQAIRRRTAESALRESEERCRTLIRNISDLITVIDSNGTMVYDTGSSERVLGYPAGYPLGRSVFEFIHPDDHGVARTALKAVVENTRSDIPIEFRVRKADGSYIWVESVGANCSETPGITGLVITFRPIDRRIRIESALRESEERFKAIFAGQETGILIIDPSEHRIVDANPYLCALIGLPREAITDHVCHTFVCPAELGSCPITDLHQRIDHSERVLVAADGRKIPILKTVARVRFGDREYLVENIQDITEQKEAENALRESEERYRALFAAESDGILVIDNETGTIVDCNDAVTGMYGYRKEELVGMPTTALSAEPEASWETAQGPGESIPIRRHRRKDGTVLQVELTANAISFRGRDLVIAAARDISDRRRVEEALATANRRLSLMSDITRHDINNQIAVIRGYVTLLERERPEPPLDDYFRAIESAAERIAAIIQFTRTFGTIGEHAPTWQEVRTLVETAIRTAPTERIEIDHDLPAGVEVFADPLIEKVVFNLIDNAARHGQGVTTVRFTVERPGGDLVLVCEDDGVGVPAAEKERIFERGFGKNTGLGLFLAREILGITGITIRETGERGARFEITVPADGVRPRETSLGTLVRAEGQGAFTPES